MQKPRTMENFLSIRRLKQKFKLGGEAIREPKKNQNIVKLKSEQSFKKVGVIIIVKCY